MSRSILRVFFCLALPLLMAPLLLSGGQQPELAVTAEAAIPASTDNWGLSFPEEGAAPVGNATQEFLSQYNAWYLGYTSRKVIYLTLCWSN